MTELMCQRDDIAERAVEVGQHAALPDRRNAHIKRTADLALTREEVDAAFLKGSLDHIMHFRIKAREDFEQIVLCFLDSILLVQSAHRCKQIPPRKTALMTECLCLCTEVFAECGHIIDHRAEEGIERFALHAGCLECLVQRRFIAAHIAIGQHLLLDGIEGECNGILDLVIAGKLGVVSVFSYGCIGIIREVAYFGQRDLLAAVFGLDRGGQIVTHIGPCRCAGNIQASKQRFLTVGEQIAVFALD